MPVNAKNQHRVESMRPDVAKSTPVANGAANSNKPMTEEEKLQAMFTENKAAWQADQADIAAYVSSIRLSNPCNSLTLIAARESTLVLSFQSRPPCPTSLRHQDMSAIDVATKATGSRAVLPTMIPTMTDVLSSGALLVFLARS